MNNYIRTATLTLLLLWVFPVSADSQADVSKVLDYFEQVWNEGDLDSIQGYYHAEFILVSNAETLTKAERLEDLKVIMTPGKDHGELSFNDVQVRALGADHVLAYGRSRLVFQDGTELGSVFSTVYVKTPFGWKALLTHE
jgi:hypothetical protein